MKKYKVEYLSLDTHIKCEILFAKTVLWAGWYNVKRVEHIELIHTRVREIFAALNKGGEIKIKSKNYPPYLRGVGCHEWNGVNGLVDFDDR